MSVTAQDDALKSLDKSGLLEILCWAAPVAFARTNEAYDEDAGHDQGVVGYLNFKHLRDLLDRATANGRFTLGEHVEGSGKDVLERGITPDAFRSMPSVPSDAIGRHDYKQSPGWAADGYRVLLQSYKFGHVDDIKWSQGSDAKRRVASQHYSGEAALFSVEEFGLEVIAGIPDDNSFEGITLVAAHAYDPITGQFELYIGQSKNPGHLGDSCWHWRQNLISGGAPIGGIPLEVSPVLPGDAASTDVDDIHIRIKKPRTAEEAGTTNG